MANRVRIVTRVSPGAFKSVLNGEYQKMNRYSRDLAKELAESTAEKAQNSFDNAEYDGENDAEVVAYLDKRNRYTVRAEGESVAFIEYGAGVYYQEPYPGDKPARFVGIGEYGKGHGKQSAWRFEMRPGVTLTSGGVQYDGTKVIGGRNTEKQIPRTANWGKGFRVSGNPDAPTYYRKFGLSARAIGQVVRNTPIVPSADEKSPFYYKKIHARERDIGRKLTKTAKTGEKWVYTHGNPPNACMYNAFMATAENFGSIAEEVKKKSD